MTTVYMIRRISTQKFIGFDLWYEDGNSEYLSNTIYNLCDQEDPIFATLNKNLAELIVNSHGRPGGVMSTWEFEFDRNNQFGYNSMENPNHEFAGDLELVEVNV